MTREERIDWLCRLRSWVVAPPLMTAEQKSKFIEALTETIKAMQTEPCEDCISRTAVLAGLANIAKNKAKSDAQKAMMGRSMFFIERLPSVQPEQKEITMEDVKAYCEPRNLVVLTKELFDSMNNTADKIYYFKERR